MNIVDRIDSLVSVRHVLLSVSDKSGLDTFIPQLVALNPEVKFFSTGGTYARIQEVLGDAAGSRLTQVSDYTGQPETPGKNPGF
jgi:phosphoribosylaminoimidazolecarboxamide formyltransferase/IMP cyclohydrolase